MKLYLETKYGDKYHILENGNIKRLDQKDFKPSGQWKLLGIKHVKKNEFIPLEWLFKGFAGTMELLYKNGNPQYTVIDFDHGAKRQWGNTKYHGVSRIQLMD